MIHATMNLKALTDLEHIFVTIGKCEPGGTRDVLEEELADRCTRIMGLPWMDDFKGKPSEAAAAIIALALLKQIEIVEDRNG